MPVDFVCDNCDKRIKTTPIRGQLYPPNRNWSVLQVNESEGFVSCSRDCTIAYYNKIKTEMSPNYPFVPDFIMSNYAASSQFPLWNDPEVVFLYTKANYGYLSNFSPDYPILVQGIWFDTIESLYQACKFPGCKEAQTEIIHSNTPKEAKRIGRSYSNWLRKDWDQVRVPIMKWCLQVKMFQREEWRSLLLNTKGKQIVEASKYDDFWGAKFIERNIYQGKNVLGLLLMNVRDGYSEDRKIDFVSSPRISDFYMVGNLIEETGGLPDDEGKVEKDEEFWSQ